MYGEVSVSNDVRSRSNRSTDADVLSAGFARQLCAGHLQR